VLTFGIEDAAILTRGTSKAQQSNNNFLNVFIGCFYDIMTANITFSQLFPNEFEYKCPNKAIYLANFQLFLTEKATSAQFLVLIFVSRATRRYIKKKCLPRGKGAMEPEEKSWRGHDEVVDF